MPPKILKCEAKVVQIIAIVTMRGVSCFVLLVVKEKFGQTSKSHNIMNAILEFSSDIHFLFLAVNILLGQIWFNKSKFSV